MSKLFNWKEQVFEDISIRKILKTKAGDYATIYRTIQIKGIISLNEWHFFPPQSIVASTAARGHYATSYFPVLQVALFLFFWLQIGSPNRIRVHYSNIPERTRHKKKKVWTNERSHRSGHVTHCQKSRFLVLRPLFHSDQLIFPLISDLWTVEKKLFLFFSNFRWTPSVGCGCNSSSWVIIATSRLHVRHTRITMTILRVCFSSSFVVHSSTHVDRVEARNKFWKNHTLSIHWFWPPLESSIRGWTPSNDETFDRTFKGL